MNLFKRFSAFGAVLVSLYLIGFAIPVSADVPAAAQLLDENENPHTSTGVKVSVTNGGSMYGLANDGENAYIINSSGNIVKVPFEDINMTPGGSVSVTGTEHTVGWGVNGAPSWHGASELSLAYSKGCLFITNASNTEGSIELYCIDTTDYSVTSLAIPSGKPLPAGGYFAYSNLIDFPDGRVGKVSAYRSVGGGLYESTLRTYTISGTGKNSVLTWAEDIIMGDNSNWAVDEHGLGTDGTYLYRIQWRDVNPNTKVWQLASGATSTVVYSGGFTRPFGNMHFLAHNHVDNYYIVGHYTSNEFFITRAENPGPGPGNPLTPIFGTVASTTDGFTVSVTNYDATFTWDVDSDFGTADINSSGVVTVTGLSAGASSTISVTAEKSGIPDGSAELTGWAEEDGVAPVLTVVEAIPEVVQEGDSITYYFRTDEMCELLVSEVDASEGEVEVLADAIATGSDLGITLNGAEVGGTYSFSFVCVDDAENESNELVVGPFTIEAEPSSGRRPSSRASNLRLIGKFAEAAAHEAQYSGNNSQSVSSTVRDLYLDDEGEDVRALQTLLIAVDTGPAARELARVGATGYFAGYTERALAEYQKQYGIVPSIGYFGSITRAEMKNAGRTGLWW